MDLARESILEWLSAESNPPVRYLAARDLLDPRPPVDELRGLRRAALEWEPLQQILALQLDDGRFPYNQKTPTAQPTFWALYLMQRCGLNANDEPAERAIDFLNKQHSSKRALSYTSGGSGVLPCYLGVMTATLIKMGALDTSLVRSSIDWLIQHQRFDHRSTRAGGESTWPYKAPTNYGCWDTASCYHGVAGAFRALGAIPPEQRTTEIVQRLSEAIEYLRVHRLYKKSQTDAPLFRHMTQFFLVGDYRSNLLDMLAAVADADPNLIHQEWVAESVRDMDNLAPDGCVPLVKNYGRKLSDPIPFESIGSPSRFLTYEWLRTRRLLDRPNGCRGPGSSVPSSSPRSSLNQ